MATRRGSTTDKMTSSTQLLIVVAVVGCFQHAQSRLDVMGSLGRVASDLDWHSLHTGRVSIAGGDFDPRHGIADSITQLVGGTPMVYLDRITQKVGLRARVAAKLEMFEPLGSVKDRIALSMIEALERQGKLTPGNSTLLEITSGNTGIGLAFVAAAKGYRLKCIMPDAFSLERRTLMLALGAELVLTSKKDGFKGVIQKAEEMLAEDPTLVYTKQFENANNPAAHFYSTGPEIWNQTRGAIDVFVVGVGTGGTLTGAGSYLKTRKPGIKVVAVEPSEAPFLLEGRAGPHGIQGIGAGFQPPTLDPAVMDDIVTVSTEESMGMARRLAQEEGIFAGISAGSAVAAAIKVASRRENEGKLVVTLLPSFGGHYLSTPLFQEYADRAAALPVHSTQGSGQAARTTGATGGAKATGAGTHPEL